MFFKRNKVRVFNIRVAIILILFALVVGVLGFMIIEDTSFIDALYMSVITISTVGFGEIKELSYEGKIFTIFLIILYISTFTYSITVITSYVIDGEFNKLLNLRKMERTINALSNHVIVIGYGRNGRQCCMELAKSKQEFIVIEQDEKVVDKIKEDGFLVINGDGTDDETLLYAGIAKAKSLISTLPLDADNVFVVLTARKLSTNVNITSRAANISSGEKLKTAGANHVVMPETIGGHYMATLVTRPDLIEFYHILTDDADTNISTEELEYENIREEYREKSISDMQLRRKTGANVIAIKNSEGKFVINPSPETVLLQGTIIIALGTKEQIQKMKSIFSIDDSE